MTVLFKGNFETGIVPWQVPGGGCQCANYGQVSNSHVQRGDFHLAAGQAEGKSIGQFVLPPSAINNGCELLHPETLPVGQDRFYGLMLKIPPKWSIGSKAFWGLSICQLGFVNISGSPFLIEVHDDHVTLAVATGAVALNGTVQNTSADGVGNMKKWFYVIPSGKLTAGWHEMIVRIHWATDKTGAFDAWWRMKATPKPTWTKTVTFTGIPTMQWRNGQKPPTYSVAKIGAYRGPSPSAITVELDNFVIGTTFNDVDGLMP